MRLAAGLSLAAPLAAAALAVAPSAGLADADPPSDVLLQQDVYLPYQPPVSRSLAAALKATVARAKQAKYPLKVAIVATEADLGAVPNMFNKPAAFAGFLSRELSFSIAPTVIVMPDGVGTANATPAATAAAARVRVDKEQKSDGLVRAAIEVVPKMATASGHPIPATPLPAKTGGGGGGGGVSPGLVFGAPVLLIALAALVVALRRRREEEDEDHADTVDDDAGSADDEPSSTEGDPPPPGGGPSSRQGA